MNTDLKSTFFEHLDPEVIQRVESRRDALRKAGRYGLALATLPVTFGLAARSAFGQALPQQVIDVLNFALTLEYLEDEYYRVGLETTGLIPDGPARVIYEQISKHEAAHVALLKGALGDAAVAKPNFDFTAGGTFDPLTNYDTYLALSQGFEDTGVRAYKGGAAALSVDGPTLETALRIHSVEARHAAEVRRLRGVSPWIEGDDVDVDALADIYAGEDNVTQGGVDVTTLTSTPSDAITTETVTEAFDETLSMDAVLDIAGLFIVSDS